MSQRKTFFESLFDISFASFITVRIIGILYIVAIALVSLGCLALLISSFRSGFGGVVVGLVVTPLAWILQVIGIRVGLESLAASIKTSENTARMLEIMQRQNP
ncbi:DUF4282 domain-containing protein [Chamaesiphon sp.]|uniref:DUF4282 domain-containing protein n=1 Tax=Chamaesiphon sp. TaxID=2814140 RepID=UPI00359454A2